MNYYTFINENVFLEVKENEIDFIKINSGIVNYIGKFTYQSQLEIFDLIKKLDSEIRDFYDKNNYNPFSSHSPIEINNYGDKKRAVDIISLGLNILNEFTEAKNKGVVISKFIDNDVDKQLKIWSFRTRDLKKVFESLI